MSRQISLVVLFIFLCTPRLLAEGLTLRVGSHDGTEATVTQVLFEKDWKVKGQRDGAAVEMDANDLVSLRFSDKTPLANPKGAYVRFPTAERLSGEVIATEGEKLKVRTTLAGETQVPLARIQGLVVTPESTGAFADLLRRATDDHSDQIYLRNQDIVDGIVQAIEPTKVVLLKDNEETPIVRDLIAAVVFDPSLVDYESGSNFFGQVRLTDGSIINALGLITEGTKIRIQAAFGSELVIDAGEIVDVSFRNGRVLYLSDVEPVRQETEAFLDGPHTVSKDRAVTGGPLRVGGQTYTKGLGVRSRSKLSYDSKKFERFEAIVGLDESSGAEGSARFLVEVDGKVAFDSGEMLATTPPRDVKINLKEAKELSLIVDFESRGDAQDYADWANARLVR